MSERRVKWCEVSEDGELKQLPLDDAPPAIIRFASISHCRGNLSEADLSAIAKALGV